MMNRIKRRRRPSILVMAAASLMLLTSVASAASINVPPNPAETTQEEATQDDATADVMAEDEMHEEAIHVPEDPSKTDASAKLEKGDTTKEGTTCRWGEHCPDPPNNNHHAAPTESQTQNDSTTTSHTLDASDSQQQQQPHIPFVPLNHGNTKTSTNMNSPPEGFVITSRVYTDPNDKLAHFDSSHSIVLEYLDCGALGSTTSPLPLKHAYFRHSMPRASAALVWSGTEFGTHPQLLIPLKPLQLVLNSGEEELFLPGSVILLEDVVQAGHKIQSPRGEDMSALLLTLPQTYHHVGKDRTSLQTSSPNSNNNIADTLRACGSAASQRELVTRKIRQAVLASLGVGLSGLMAFFLGKVAPLWLSVGVGGTCFIVGGTYATVTCGEYLWQEGELALERRRLKSSRAQFENDEQQDYPERDLLLKEQELLLKKEQVGR